MSQPFIARAGQRPNIPDEPPAEPIQPSIAKDRASYVRASIQRIEQLQKQGRTPAEIETLVPEFKRDYPKLYDTVMTPGYHKQSLQTMLAMLDRMGTGQLSQHDASVIVGQRVFDSFVKPQMEGQRRSS